MSKSDRIKKRRLHRGRRVSPSAPRVIGANDNFVNDNEPVIVGGVTLNARLSAAFRQAEADQVALQADERPDLPRRREGHLAMLQIQQELESILDAQRMKAVRAEIAALEKRRGGDLTVTRGRDQRGQEGEQYRVSRDGLETLRTTESITRTQHSAGLLFRTDYELLDPEKGLTPPPLDQSRNIVRGGEGFAKKRQEREAFVRDLEALIQEEDPTFRGALGRTDIERVGRSVWALREIAGKGSNLASLSTSGSVQTRLSAALIVALDCAAIAYGLE